MPGRGVASPHDFNDQLEQWLPTANARRVWILDGRPADFLDPDRAQMLALPPVEPVVASVMSVRLGRAYYVRVTGNDYSLDPSAIGQLIEVTTTLAQVTVTRSGRLMAVHDRCWAAQHLPTRRTAAAALRHQFQADTPPAAGNQLLQDLANYDRAFGVDFSTGTAMSDGELV